MNKGTVFVIVSLSFPTGLGIQNESPINPVSDWIPTFVGMTDRGLGMTYATMDIRIIKDSISKSELKTVAEEMYGDLVKAVVDLEKGLMALGGEMHADEEQVLLEQGSRQQDLWGINLYPEHQGEDFVEFDSMINLRPSQGNRSRSVEDPAVQQKIRALVGRLVR